MTHLLSRLIGLGLLVSTLTLASCAVKNYTVLLPDDDGKLGAVVVTSAQGQTVLNSKNQGTEIGGPAGKTFVVSDAQIRKDFGAALAAVPLKASNYVLYFEAGGINLTPESQALIPGILNEVQQRPGADLSVIGHSDTKGDAQSNYDLALTRARHVAERIGSTVISADRISVASHGEKNLLIPTVDDVDEPRNRRVEVTVR